MLADGQRDALKEFGWAMVALATGSGPTAVPLLLKHLNPPVAALKGFDMLQILMFVSGLVLAAGCLIVVSSRGKKTRNLLADIKAGK